MKLIHSIEELKSYLGAEIGQSPTIKITQELIDKFANATLDFQWIHTNPTEAAIHSPFKSTIAHGFLTLALTPHLVSQTYKISSAKVSINYGADKIRFTAPVPVDSELYIKILLKDIRAFENGYRITSHCSYHILSNAKAVCHAELISLVYES